MGLFDLINHCQELEELNFFVLSDVWKDSPKVRNAILIHYEQLDPHHQQRSHFGTKQFWEAVPIEKYDELVKEDAIPDGFQLVDEWKEGDTEDPWMLEEEYRQAGGQAKIQEEPMPDLKDLYNMKPYHHEEYKRYHSGRVACSVQFKETSKMNDFYSLAEAVRTDILDKLFISVKASISS